MGLFDRIFEYLARSIFTYPAICQNKLPNAMDMPLKMPSAADLKNLLSTGSWALKLIWSTNASLTAALGAASFARGIVPAGFALFARGLINVIVGDGGPGAQGLSAVLPWLLFGLAVTVVEAIAPLVQKFCSERLHDNMNLRITSDILDHSERLDLAFFESSTKRDLLDRARQNPAEPFMKFVVEAQSAVTYLLQTISLAAVLIMIEPLVVLAVPPFAVPYLLFRWRLSKKRYQERYRRARRARWTRYFVSLLTGRQSVAEVKLLDLGPLLRDKFRAIMTQFRDRNRTLHLRGFGGSMVFAVVTIIAFYLIFLRVIAKVLNGVLTVGDVAVFGAASARLRLSLEGVIRSLSMALEQTLYISNLMEFFNERPQIVSGSSPLSRPCNAEIKFSNVSFTYPGCQEPALRDISLHIRPGETVAIVGENGAGKTTLVKLLARLYDPDSGCVEFDHIDLRSLSLGDLRKQIGFVLQDFGRYEATAAENIAYGDWRLMLGHREEVEQIARLAGVDPMIRSMPAGYETLLGRLFGEHDLSRGQWQKLAIARAFVRDTSLLILDEPAASLSVQAEYELFSRFHELSQGRTTILISHRFSTLSIADRIIVMEKGRIIEGGTHEELLDRAGTYSRLYRMHRHPLAVIASNSGKLRSER